MLPLPAGRDASAGAPRYTRHRPERTLLYQLVREYCPAFTAHLAAQGTFLPSYVEREFEDYLKCGRLEVMGRVLGIVYRCIATHLIKKAGFSCKTAQTGAVTLALRIGRSLERQGLLERDPENSWLAGDELETGPIAQLLGASITYRIAVAPHQGRKVFTLQTLPAARSRSRAGPARWPGSRSTPGWQGWARKSAPTSLSQRRMQGPCHD
jgi:hypothetical protein